jgi:hypothetical protein
MLVSMLGVVQVDVPVEPGGFAVVALHGEFEPLRGHVDAESFVRGALDDVLLLGCRLLDLALGVPLGLLDPVVLDERAQRDAGRGPGGCKR